MNIILIPEKTNLIMGFSYKEKKYNLEVTVIKKISDILYITAICIDDKPLTHKELSNINITYIVENGYYIFEKIKFNIVKIGDIYAYAIKNNFETERINRRESFRVFIGEILKVVITKEDGGVSEHIGILKDLSTIGMGIVINKEIKNVKTISIFYSIDNLKVNLTGKCVRYEKLSKRNEYIYGCKFYGRNEMLSKFVTNRQIKNKISKDFYRQKKKS